MDFIGNLAGYALAIAAGVAVGALFHQRIADWFAGVEADLRAKANEAGKAVLAAAQNEASKAKQAARDAADKAVAGAKDAAGIEPVPVNVVAVVADGGQVPS